MSSFSIGSPVVAYAYKYDAKGRAFNKVFNNIMSPGIYNGGGLSFVGNKITLAPYDALFPSTDNQLVAIHTSAPIDLSTAQPSGFGLGDISSSTPYIAMTFVWADSTTEYPDYGFFDASILSNYSYLILGRATFSGSAVTGFSYNESTLPPRYNYISKSLSIRGIADASSSITGAITVEGGVGIAKKLYTGDSIVSSSTVQGTQLKSTIATGTSPLTVNSTTKVTNLNADAVDDKHIGSSGNSIPLLDGANTWSGTQTHNDIPAFNGGTSGTSAPFTVNSTYKVTNLNCDLLDDHDSSYFGTASAVSTLQGYFDGSGNAKSALKLNRLPAMNQGSTPTALTSYCWDRGAGVAFFGSTLTSTALTNIPANCPEYFDIETYGLTGDTIKIILRDALCYARWECHVSSSGNLPWVQLTDVKGSAIKTSIIAGVYSGTASAKKSLAGQTYNIIGSFTILDRYFTDAPSGWSDIDFAYISHTSDAWSSVQVWKPYNSGDLRSWTRCVVNDGSATAWTQLTDASGNALSRAIDVTGKDVKAEFVSNFPHKIFKCDATGTTNIPYAASWEFNIIGESVDSGAFHVIAKALVTLETWETLRGYGEWRGGDNNGWTQLTDARGASMAQSIIPVTSGSIKTAITNALSGGAKKVSLYANGDTISDLPGGGWWNIDVIPQGDNISYLSITARSVGNHAVWSAYLLPAGWSAGTVSIWTQVTDASGNAINANSLGGTAANLYALKTDASGYIATVHENACPGMGVLRANNTGKRMFVNVTFNTASTTGNYYAKAEVGASQTAADKVAAYAGVSITTQLVASYAFNFSFEVPVGGSYRVSSVGSAAVTANYWEETY